MTTIAPLVRIAIRNTARVISEVNPDVQTSLRRGRPSGCKPLTLHRRFPRPDTPRAEADGWLVTVRTRMG